MFDSRFRSNRLLLDARSRATRPAFEPGEDASLEVARRTQQGLAALSRGEHRVAVEWLEQALVAVDNDAARVGLLAALLEALRGVAEESAGPLAARLYRRGRRMLKLALPLARQHPDGLAHVLREAALLAAERGRRERCRQLLAESLDVALRLGQAREAARTLYARGSLGILWGWSNAAQERSQGRAALRELEPSRTGEPTEAVAGGSLVGLVDWSCRLASIQSSPLPMLEEGLRALLPATRVLIMPHALDARYSHPILAQVAQRGHVVVGTEEDRVVLGAPVFLRGGLHFLVFAERYLRMGPFDNRSVLLAQFLTGLAGAALENERNFEEQDQLRARLQESETHFRELFQGVDVGLALVGAEDRILEVNKSLSELLGAPEETLVGSEFRDFLHPLDRAAEDRRFRELLEGRCRHYQCELRFLRAGTPAWAQLTTAPLPGFPRLAVRTLVDVSFARIKALMELEEQERTWLAADLHDAPAQTAAALCFQLQAMYAQRPGPELAEAVRGAERLSSRLRKLLSDLSNPVLAGDSLGEALSRLLGQPVEVGPGADDPVVFRLVQECAASVDGARSLQLQKEENLTRLIISYQGRLRNLNFLRHRCLLLGGELHTEQPGTVVIELPF